jgi:hypothetical protein
MGTHRRRGLRRLALGSDAEMVWRGCSEKGNRGIATVFMHRSSAGLEVGERIVLYPNDRIAGGVRIVARGTG